MELHSRLRRINLQVEGSGFNSLLFFARETSKTVGKRIGYAKFHALLKWLTEQQRGLARYFHRKFFLFCPLQLRICFVPRPPRYYGMAQGRLIGLDP
jgi:hypothetical protein